MKWWDKDTQKKKICDLCGYLTAACPTGSSVLFSHIGGSKHPVWVIFVAQQQPHKLQWMRTHFPNEGLTAGRGG